MVVLIAKNTVKEGLQQEFLKLAKEMTVKTRQEKGCISYDLASDQSDAQVFYFIEKYQDEKAVEFQKKWIPLEELYFEKCRTRSRCDVCFTMCDEM